MARFKILTPGNPKTEKGRGAGYWTFILHLAPAKLSGFNVCPMATAGCEAACLNTAGRGGMMKGVARLTVEDVKAGKVNTIQAARIRKTKWFFESRETFLFALVREMETAVRLARKAGLEPVFRLNGTSDIRWEAVKVPAMAGTWSSKPEGSANLFEHFGDVRFYDYTKLPNRKGLPANYTVVFSLADGNREQAVKAFRNGLNVAVVFRDKATVAFYEANGFALAAAGDYVVAEVVNGDETDLRFLDPKGVVVGLYAKGNAKRDTSGFVVD